MMHRLRGEGIVIMSIYFKNLKKLMFKRIIKKQTELKNFINKLHPESKNFIAQELAFRKITTNVG